MKKRRRQDVATPDASAPRLSAAWVAAIALSGALALAYHAWRLAEIQGGECIDDAYIFFRYAQSWVDGQGVVFNAGERVEGYTSFGWLAILTAALRSGLDLARFSRFASGGLGAAAVAITALSLGRSARRPLAAMLLAAAILATDGGLARWSQDGMETAAFVFSIVLAAFLEERHASGRGRFWVLALAWSVATLLRPEGLLLFGAARAVDVLAGGADRRRAELRRGLAVVAAWAVPVGAHGLWRHAYYGAWLPNTFYAKVGMTESQVARGLDYLHRYFWIERPHLVVLAALALVLPKWTRLDHYALRTGALGLVLLAHVVAVGGDWMGSGRFLTPVLALLVVPLAEMVTAIRVPKSLGAVALIIALIVVSWRQYLATSIRSEQASVREERAYLESRRAVGEWLKTQAAFGDSLLTNEIGQLAWYSGLKTHDVHGLTDPRIARMKLATIGQGRAGHEKSDLPYSYSKHPTWVAIASIGRDHRSIGARFPPFADYQVVKVSVPLPLPDYSEVLRRKTE